MSNYFTQMCRGSEAGSYLRLIDFCITQRWVLEKSDLRAVDFHSGVPAVRISLIHGDPGRFPDPSQNTKPLHLTQSKILNPYTLLNPQDKILNP